MISQKPRCIYGRNPLAEVICQLRFPQILTVETQLPAAFQEAIREEFPLFTQRKEGPPGKQSINYQFASADNVWRVNLTSRFISLACTRYHCWEEFARKLDRPLAAFIQIYKPAFFDRIGLRYVNFISRMTLELDNIPFRELISPCYLGILGCDTVTEAGTSRCTTDIDTALEGGCRLKLHAGPGNVTLAGRADPEVKFVLDLDLYMQGNIPVNLSAGALQTLHSQSYGVFRGAITDQLHESMEPES